jgi:hypothetical protein
MKFANMYRYIGVEICNHEFESGFKSILICYGRRIIQTSIVMWT